MECHDFKECWDGNKDGTCRNYDRRIRHHGVGCFRQKPKATIPPLSDGPIEAPGYKPSWIKAKDQMPDMKEPVVYARRKHGSERWLVGVAYWCVSERWIPELECTKYPNDIVLWMPLPDISTGL